ncbi:protein SCO1 [Gammaproteobacteria bacterium]
MSRWLQNTLPILAVVALLLILTMVQRDESPAPPSVPGATLLDPPRPLAPFYLVDQHGVVIDRARLEGRWTLLFFGYTHCLDLCLATLAALAATQEQLSVTEAGSEEVQVIFVSIDPARDTSDAIDQYLSRFNSAFVGAVAEPEALAGLANQFGVTWRRGSNHQTGDHHPIEHNRTVFVINPEVQWYASLTPPLEAARLTETIRIIRIQDVHN